jgi:hypothetical protein
VTFPTAREMRRISREFSRLPQLMEGIRIAAQEGRYSVCFDSLTDADAKALRDLGYQLEQKGSVIRISWEKQE